MLSSFNMPDKTFVSSGPLASRLYDFPLLGWWKECFKSSPSCKKGAFFIWLAVKAWTPWLFIIEHSSAHGSSGVFNNESVGSLHGIYSFFFFTSEFYMVWYLIYSQYISKRSKRYLHVSNKKERIEYSIPIFFISLKFI